MASTLGLVLAALTGPTGIFGGSGGLLQLVAFPALLIGFFYFMIMRPQQMRARDHAQRIAAIKRGDTVVLSSGLIGKVVRVEDRELGVEVAQNVTVKVVKTMVAEVRSRGEPAAANDAKA